MTLYLIALASVALVFGGSALVAHLSLRADRAADEFADEWLAALDRGELL